VVLVTERPPVISGCPRSTDLWCSQADSLCVVLPCHRVVASSGALTAYSGGLAAKEYLLALESRP